MITTRNNGGSKRLSHKSAKFLSFISQTAEVRYVFVKAQPDSSARSMLGYFEYQKLDQIEESIVQFDGSAAGIYYAINPVDPACLSRSKNSLGPTSSANSCHAGDITRRTLLLVDIDPVREPSCSATDSEKNLAYILALMVYRNLVQAGWPKPVVVDSGNGYHLLFRIDLPADDGGLVKRCLLALAKKFERHDVKIDTSVHDAPRLAKLSGTMACKGIGSDERPHRRSGVLKYPEKFEIVPAELLTKLAESIPMKTSPPKADLSGRLFDSSPELIRRARAYLEAMPPAISGQKGRNHFLNAACRMVDDFAFSRDQALMLLAEFNGRCKPPFNEREIADKLDSALAKVAERGGPSGSKAGSSVAELGTTGPRFAGYIPDFGLSALVYVMGDREKPLPVGEMIHRFSLWHRLHVYGLVPDVLLRQLVWGAKHDKNWRARLAKKPKVLGRLTLLKSNNVCSADNCMLYGTKANHQHYSRSREKYHILESFRPKNDINHIHGNRFLLYSNEFKELRENLQRKGILLNVYWPAFILAGSPKVGWTWPQQLLVSGMVRELTRTKPKAGELVTGEVIKGQMVAATGLASRLVPCPFLDPNQEYVVFAGNGKRKGRGYQIIGRTDKGWLHRCGYKLPPRDPLGQSDKQRRGLMKPFLTDLAFLSQELGLVPVGVLNGQWRSMGLMMDCLRTGNGQDWLEACTLRIYAIADWRARWRRYFSDKLGFAWIPETPEDSGFDATSAIVSDPNQSVSAHEIRIFLKKQGWTQSQLAERIAATTGNRCSSRRVERNLGGNGPTAAFLKDFAKVQATSLTDRQSQSLSDIQTDSATPLRPGIPTDESHQE